MTNNSPNSNDALLKQAQQAADKAAKAVFASNPLADGLGVSVTVRRYRARPSSLKNFERDVVQLFVLSDNFLRMSNAALIEHMQEKHGEERIPASWFTTPLKPWVKKAVSAILSQHGKSLDLRGKVTLSAIKKALKGDAARTNQTTQFDAQFSFGENYVEVNGQSYKIITSPNGYRRIRVGSQWLPVRTLEALLEKSSILLSI